MIAHAVRLYLRFALSVRDREALLAERGGAGSYETGRRWVAKCGAPHAEALRRRRPHTSRTWHLEEMAVRIEGRLHWLWRAVNEHGQTLDVFRQAQRDTAAAARCCRRLVDVTAGTTPARITTDQLGSDAAALRAVPELAGVEPLQVRSARRCTNRVEPAHQSTRLRERVRRRFKLAVSAQRFLDAFAGAARLFRPRRHLRTAAAYRATMRDRVTLGHEVAGLRAA